MYSHQSWDRSHTSRSNVVEIAVLTDVFQSYLADVQHASPVVSALVTDIDRFVAFDHHLCDNVSAKNNRQCLDVYHK